MFSERLLRSSLLERESKSTAAIFFLQHKAEMEQSVSPRSLCITTWNIHNLYTMSPIIQSIRRTPVDILGLQEVLQYAKGINRLKECFGTEHNTGFFHYHHGVAMASKYQVVASYAARDRMLLNIIQFTKDITIGIIVVHFNYRNENVRIAEFSQITQLVADHQNIPLILIGDFNALTRTDYTDTEWANITKIRSENQWEEPKTELMSLIKGDGAFMDSLYVFKNSKKNQIGVGENKIIENEHDDRDVSKQQETQKLNGEKWIDLLGEANVGTCKFDTRIDYVLINQKMQSMFDVVEYQHVERMFSDHKMVRVRFELKSPADHVRKYRYENSADNHIPEAFNHISNPLAVLIVPPFFAYLIYLYFTEFLLKDR